MLRERANKKDTHTEREEREREREREREWGVLSLLSCLLTGLGLGAKLPDLVPRPGPAAAPAVVRRVVAAGAPAMGAENGAERAPLEPADRKL
eukprot:COSAG05_NODE_649_length_8102_cov_157.470823_6_plen_93_part_00